MAPSIRYSRGPMRTGRRRLAALSFVLATGLALTGCVKQGTRGDLAPPANAAAWDPIYDNTFDDHYNQTTMALSGRAPGDVIDQRRLAQRLGFADLVLLVQVDQVWSRGLHGGAATQRLDVTLGRVLLGVLPKGTRKDQVLSLRGGEELPGDLTGRVMLLFLRWAPGEGQGYHHHVMPAEDSVIEWIEALARHARALGKLDPIEKSRAGKRGRRSRGTKA